MSFTVTASTAAREVRFQRGSLLAALEQALMLSSSGLQGVRIIDGNGRSRTPAEVSRALLGAGDGGDRPRVDPLAA